MGTVVQFDRGLDISFEVFPPKTVVDREVLVGTVAHLQSFNPRFVSVTYGAGGTTQQRTLSALQLLHGRLGCDMAGHLTCVGATREEVDATAMAFWNAGVRRIVALRGDPPRGADRFEPHPGGYENAADLVAGLRRLADFDISVAAYPEVHPESESVQADIENLKRKFDAGADRALTQFFFEPETFLRFRDRALAAGISAPLVPGILPINNFESVRRFAGKCGSAIPGWMARAFEDPHMSESEKTLISASLCVEMCMSLREEGVRHFHFYTLNRPDLSSAVCRLLGLVPSRPVWARAA